MFYMYKQFLIKLNNIFIVLQTCISYRLYIEMARIFIKLSIMS